MGFTEKLKVVQVTRYHGSSLVIVGYIMENIWDLKLHVPSSRSRTSQSTPRPTRFRRFETQQDMSIPCRKTAIDPGRLHSVIQWNAFWSLRSIHHIYPYTYISYIYHIYHMSIYIYMCIYIYHISIYHISIYQATRIFRIFRLSTGRPWYSDRFRCKSCRHDNRERGTPRWNLGFL